ncbi:acetate and sugar kinases/Hsc70/actin family protein [Fusobacterium pseudoperiodonticum]|uniref:hypothetical protein n=1 Tax=Fusobacterium pseudoperiodonticum TaxID=2663009 RepID=UPI000C1C27C6|nr:hypothetical protein [Fusobacterium pseudoperiodonticum]ATV64710.1 hypothetical protein CTM78_10150 [Fusobacterium pseudoperiodonticum]
MDYIYVRKSEILKKEIIENIKANLFNKKKAIEEGLTKGIFSNGNIPVKYKDKKYIYNTRANRFFPDFKSYNFTSLELGEKSIQDIKNIFSEEFKDFEEIEILSEDIYRRVFYRENNKYIEDGKILNTDNMIENYIIEKDGNLLIVNSQAEEIESEKAILIPVIKILAIEANNAKKELETIIKSFKENEIEILFNHIEKRYKEKYDELVELYNDIEKYNFSEDNSDYDKIEILKSFENGELELPLNFIDEYLEKLKNIEKIRLDEKEYDEKIFTDYQKGNWDIFSDSKEGIENRELIKIATTKKYYERDPKKDVKDGGIVAIDFGTKSTVVAIQTQNEKTSLVRIAGGSYKKNVEKSQFENPTIMEFIDIESFEKAYSESKGRPFTKWDDLKVSYAANSSFIGGSKFILEGLKQWAGNKDEKLVIYDKKWKRIDLKPYIDVEEDEFDPIEYYAYYIGSYINNMFTGNIFTKYLLSFPIKYENEIRVKILKSFEKGIKKSLPTSILENEKIMDNFQVYRGANEPTAYFLCAGRELDKFPKKENERLFYGIFDFGGGTTDFSFGLCKYIGLTSSRYDYEIKHFGEGGDKFLGGENILKNLAFEICKDNLATLKEKDIHFYCPVGCKEFDGYEGILDNSYEAIYNIKQIAEKFRGFWEEDELSNDLYSSNEITVTLLSSKDSSETINLKFDKVKCEEIINSILRKGIENFISSLKLLFKNDNLGADINKMEIFLSGNSSKSKRFQKMFEEEIQKIEVEINKNKNEKIFTINYPIQKIEKKDSLGVNAKTGTAIGLLESRKGGKFKIIAKDEETNDNEINFRYYVGYLKNSKFKPVLDYKVGYDNWVKFLDASDIETEIYYTHQANSIEGGISGDNSNLDRKIITISKDYQDEDTYIFIRATKPDIIEYCVSTEKKIKKNEFIEEAQELKLM